MLVHSRKKGTPVTTCRIESHKMKLKQETLGEAIHLTSRGVGGMVGGLSPHKPSRKSSCSRCNPVTRSAAKDRAVQQVLHKTCCVSCLMAWQCDQASFNKAPQQEKVGCKGPFHPVSRNLITLIVFKWLCGHPVSVCSFKRSHLENHESVDFTAFCESILAAEVMVHIPHLFLVRNMTQTSRRLANDPSKLDSHVFFWTCFRRLRYTCTSFFFETKSIPPISKLHQLHLCSFDLRANLFLATHGWSLPSRWKCLPCCFTKKPVPFFGSKKKYWE